MVNVGDYISLYQQQREQLHRRYQEKDDYIKQLTQDRLNLQVNPMIECLTKTFLFFFREN